MDTSEQYIKMCEKAEEIQKLSDDYSDEYSISCWHAPNHVQCKGHFSDWHMAYKFCPVCRKALKITPEYSICRRLDNDSIWLPRQDQLQEMVIPPYNGFIHAWYGFRDFVNSLAQVDELMFIPSSSTSLFYDHILHNSGNTVPGFTSMEQLWLAFVMKERFNKQWSGTDWE